MRTAHSRQSECLVSSHKAVACERRVLRRGCESNGAGAYFLEGASDPPFMSIGNAFALEARCRECSGRPTMETRALCALGNRFPANLEQTSRFLAARVE